MLPVEAANRDTFLDRSDLLAAATVIAGFSAKITEVAGKVLGVAYGGNTATGTVPGGARPRAVVASAELPSISSTFFARVFCTNFLPKPKRNKKKLPKRCSYKKFVRKNVDEIETWPLEVHHHQECLAEGSQVEFLEE